MRRPLAFVLVALLGCGAAPTPGADARAEWRARRASERVTGPDGQPARGFPHRGGLDGGGGADGGLEDPQRVADAGDAAGGRGGAGGTGAGVAAPRLDGGRDAQAPADRKYKIVLSPPATVGEKTWERSEATVTTETFVRVNGSEVGHKVVDRTVRIAGLATVDEVDAEGIPLVYSLEVAEAKLEAGGQRRELAGRGDVIEVRRKGPKPRISVNGQAPAPADLEALELVLTTSDPGATNDQTLGSREPRAVGETWPIDAARTAEDLSRAGTMRVEAAAVSGLSALVAAKTCGKAQTCLLIRSTIDIANFDIVGLPPAASMRGAESTVVIEALQPLDVRKAPGVAKMDMRVRWVIGMQQGDRDVEMESVMTTRQVGWSEPR